MYALQRGGAAAATASGAAAKNASSRSPLSHATAKAVCLARLHSSTAAAAVATEGARGGRARLGAGGGRRRLGEGGVVPAWSGGNAAGSARGMASSRERFGAAVVGEFVARGKGCGRRARLFGLLLV